MASAPLASATVGRHLARGALGLVALVAAVAGAAAGAPAALALLLVTVAAWRGCPSCWAIGLMQTRERAACPDGGCRPAHAPAASSSRPAPVAADAACAGETSGRMPRR